MKDKIKDKEITLEDLAIMVSNGFDSLTDNFNKKIDGLRWELKDDVQQVSQKVETLIEDLQEVNLKIDLVDKRVNLVSKHMVTKKEIDLLDIRVKRLEAVS
jgi:hypothetical protein